MWALIRDPNSLTLNFIYQQNSLLKERNFAYLEKNKILLQSMQTADKDLYFKERQINAVSILPIISRYVQICFETSANIEVKYFI